MAHTFAGMATLSERPVGRARAVESLLGQVDQLTLVCGDYRGDQAKFDPCQWLPDDAVYLTADDDLIYPLDYVERTLEALERWPEAIVSYHGWRILRSGGRGESFCALGDVSAEQSVDVIGTCCCAFRIATIRPLPSDFPMLQADLWLSLRAARERIPLIVLPHTMDFFGYVAPTRTIYDETLEGTGSELDATVAYREAIPQLVEAYFS